MVESIKYGLFLAYGFIFLGANLLLAQQKPITSQYMFNELAINPAFAGSHQWFSATAMYRDQWVNLDGSPTTSTFSMHTGMSSTKVGLGILAYKDQIGIHDDFGLYGSYSYFVDMGSGVLYMGLQGGFNTLKSDFNKLRLRNPDDPLLSGVRRVTNPNFGAGALWRGRNYFVSFSVPWILNNQIVDLNNVVSDAREFRNYYLYMGATFALGPYVKLKPSTLFRVQEGQPISLDVNAQFVIHDRISFGASYRSVDALVMLFEFEISQSLHLGYSYDYITSELNQFSNGTHGVMLNYRFKIEPVQKASLDCPSYW